MASALIQPRMLEWARKRAGFAIEVVAKKLSVKDTAQILAWEQGTESPTFVQAQKAARVLHVPFGYLFLKAPPEEDLFIPDLRTICDRPADKYSLDLRDTIADVMRKMEWYKDYQKEIGATELEFAGKFSSGDGYKKISASITQILRLKLGDRATAHNWEDFFKLLVERAEESGIVVLRSGKVGSDTTRILDVNEFRGFAVFDKVAPFIFINGADAKPAQIFTLVHELVHIWLGKSGVSNNGLTMESVSLSGIEKLCNDVAAETLVPEKDLSDRWNQQSDLHQQLSELAAFYKVSTVVVARRLFDLALIDKDDFAEFYRIQASRWEKSKNKQKSGGSYYLTLPVANGKSFTRAVLYSVFAQKTLARDGARLLGIKPSNLDKLAQAAKLI